MSVATLNEPTEVADRSRQSVNTIEPRGGVAAVAVANNSGQSQALSVDVGEQVAESNSALPSLEELVGDVEGATQSTNASSPAAPHRTTTTPAGIPDWSKYLPPLDQAVDVQDRSAASYTEVPQP